MHPQFCNWCLYRLILVRFLRRNSMGITVIITKQIYFMFLSTAHLVAKKCN